MMGDEMPNVDETIVQESEDLDSSTLNQDDDRALALRIHRQMNNGGRKSVRLQSQTTFCVKKYEAATITKLVAILKKNPDARSPDEKAKIDSHPRLVLEAQKRLMKRTTAVDRLRELEDPEEVLNDKCEKLAGILRNSKYLVVYTGAGISTSASIPDYRGPNGIWTLLQKGKSLASENQTLLTTADPTLTHMAIYELYRQGIIKHVVSQNCDGLHLRSGVSKVALSEVHGNMYIEVCATCNREYVRLFDVTENTRRHEHRTGRICYNCSSLLKDTIVHFGEKGSLRWPLNWMGAQYNAGKADVILCLGSSLKVLRRYPWLWCMDKPMKQRPTLCIVNLQWTPKDQFATLKINGKCDGVMEKVMQLLNIELPKYRREADPLFVIATPLHPSEASTKTAKELTLPDSAVIEEQVASRDSLQDYVSFEPTFAPEMVACIGKSSLKRGNGSGWLGNAWGVKPKSRKKIKKELS